MKRLALVFMAGCLTFGLLELTVSAFAGRVDPVTVLDPDTMYAYRPGLDLVSITDEYRITFRTDSLGLRVCGSGETAREPASGGLYFIGDSFTEGLGVECEKTFPAAAARELKREFFNAGMHGGAPPFYQLRNHKFLKVIHPEAVFIQIYDNDLLDMDAMSGFLSISPDGEARLNTPPASKKLAARITENSALLWNLRLRWMAMRGKDSPLRFYRPASVPPGPPEPSVRTEDGAFDFYGRKLDGPWVSRLEKLEKSLRVLIRQTRTLAPQSRVFVIHIPGRPLYTYNPAEQLANPVRSMTQKTSREEGAEFIDGQIALSRDPGSRYFEKNGHINGAGHRAIADAVVSGYRSGLRFPMRVAR